jgi:hypothetical protein
VLLQLILDAGAQHRSADAKASLTDMWSILYHHVITPTQLRLVREASGRLLEALATKELWNAYPLGKLGDRAKYVVNLGSVVNMGNIVTLLYIISSRRACGGIRIAFHSDGCL